MGDGEREGRGREGKMGEKERGEERRREKEETEKEMKTENGEKGKRREEKGKG